MEPDEEEEREGGGRFDPQRPTYCPWCMGPGLSVLYQSWGLAAKVCPMHGAMLMREAEALPPVGKEQAS